MDDTPPAGPGGDGAALTNRRRRLALAAAALRAIAQELPDPRELRLSTGAAAGAIQALIVGQSARPPWELRLWIRPADEPYGLRFGDALDHRLGRARTQRMLEAVCALRAADPLVADTWISGGFAVGRRDCEADDDALSGCAFTGQDGAAAPPRIGVDLARGCAALCAGLSEGEWITLHGEDGGERASAHERLEARAAAHIAGAGFAPALAAALADFGCPRARVVRTGPCAVLVAAHPGIGYGRGLIERAWIPSA